MSTVINSNTLKEGDISSKAKDPANFIAVHPVAGNTVTIDKKLKINNKKFAVVFINSLDGTPVNLSIQDKIDSKDDKGGMIIWIVSGNVSVDSSVEQADGYFIVTGSYNSGSGNKKLDVQGGVAAYGGVNLSRRNNDTTQPSEVFTYDPLITTFAPLIGESAYSWTETIP